MNIKRFVIAPLLVLCLVTSFFSFSAFADNQCGVYLTINSLQQYLSDGSQVLKAQNLSGDYYTYNFNYIYIPSRYWIRNDELTIRIGWKSFDGTWFQEPTQSHENYSPSNLAIPLFQSVSSTSGWHIDSGFQIMGVNVSLYGALIRIRCQLSNYSGIVTIKPNNLQAKFAAPLAPNVPPYFILGVDSTPDWKSIFSELYDIRENTYHILSNAYDFYDLLCYTNAYDVTSVTFNQDDGSMSIEETNGLTWYEAILNVLQTISAPVVSQAQYENKANEVGADDALDGAYDSVGNSFGSLSDLGGLGSFGQYNGDALGENGASSLLGWFTQACKDDIDAVTSNRMRQSSGGQQFISIFDEHIEDYKEEVNSDDSTAH